MKSIQHICSVKICICSVKNRDRIICLTSTALRRLKQTFPAKFFIIFPPKFKYFRAITIKCFPFCLLGVVYPAVLQRRDHQRHPAVPQHFPFQRLPAHHALTQTDLLKQPRQGGIE